MKTWQFGPLTITLSGSGSVHDALSQELSSLPAATPAAEADIHFRFVEKLATAGPTVEVGRWRLAEGYVARNGHGYAFSMTREDGIFEVSIAPTTTDGNPLSRTYRQVWDWNYLTPAQTTAKNIMYNLFDLVTGAAFLEKDATYLHASTCAREDDAVALIAWGGVGKTTSVLKLVTEDGWRFMSDDLGLVDADANLFRNPKRLQIYAYNVVGQPELFQRLMKGRGPADLVNWKWRKARFGDKKVRRRVDARELFGEANTVDSAPLTQAVFLERVDIPKIKWRSIDPEKMAQRSAAILVDELDTLFELAIAAESHGIDVGIKSHTELREMSREVLVKAFEDIPTRCLQIPLDAGPDELADALRIGLN